MVNTCDEKNKHYWGNTYREKKKKEYFSNGLTNKTLIQRLLNQFVDLLHMTSAQANMALMCQVIFYNNSSLALTNLAYGTTGAVMIRFRI